MLARTADSLFWLGRYTERAANVARGLGATLRMAAFAGPRGEEAAEWRRLLDATGGTPHYEQLYGDPVPAQVVRWLTSDTLNPSSIASSFEAARRNGRAVRTALTVDMWEAVNDTWMDLRKLDPGDAGGDRLAGFLDWVRSRTVLFNGAAMDTMLRDDAWRFVRLGTMLERSDNTVRLLAARQDAFAPDTASDAMHHAQWQNTLRAVSAIRAYQHLFRERLRPERVVELLIARPELPRSARACYAEVCSILEVLTATEGGGRSCRRVADELKDRCGPRSTEGLSAVSLGAMLTGLIEGNANLGASLGECFLNG